MEHKGKRQAVAYLRTSSSANVGADKDSEKRQRAAIEAYAKSAGYDIVATFYDAAVSGADPVDERPGFAAMMKRLEANGARTIIVETASRFARDLMVQEVGHRMLTGRGIALVAADSPDSFLDDTPTAALIRQVLGAVAQFEKAMLVAKLKGARDRKRATGVKVEGRRAHAESGEHGQAMVALAKKLHRYPVNGKRRSLRQIAQELATAGYCGKDGKPYAAMSVQRMVTYRAKPQGTLTA